MGPWLHGRGGKFNVSANNQTTICKRSAPKYRKSQFVEKANRRVWLVQCEASQRGWCLISGTEMHLAPFSCEAKHQAAFLYNTSVSALEQWKLIESSKKRMQNAPLWPENEILDFRKYRAQLRLGGYMLEMFKWRRLGQTWSWWTRPIESGHFVPGHKVEAVRLILLHNLRRWTIPTEAREQTRLARQIIWAFNQFSQGRMF
jgi:hypothetical protein